MWRVEFAAQAERDFDLIFDHLLQSYQEFGDEFDVAIDRTAQRLLSIQSAAQDLAKIPYQGTLRPDILDGLRFVRHNQAVYWFVADEDRKTVQVLAIFYGGQDHIRHMLTRLLSDQP